MASYPEGTLVGESLEGHVMGVVALAWLTRFPVEAWGSDWLERGTIDMRFRRHLETGRPLIIEAERGAGEIELAIRDEEGALYASGIAGLREGSGGRPLPREPRKRRGGTSPIPPTPEALRDHQFRPLRFRFEAVRDLAFVDRLVDADFWRAERTAHPAWIGSAANAVTRRDVDFEDGGGWLHAGLCIDLHAPVREAADLEIGGYVDSLFERGGRRFAVAALEVYAGETCVASLRNTFVYATTQDTPHVRS